MSDKELIPIERHLAAWQWLVENMNNHVWTLVPVWVKQDADLPNEIIAVCDGGFHQSQASVRGMREFISRLNAVKEK